MLVIVFISILLYLLISAGICCAMDYLFMDDKINLLAVPKQAWIFYLLQLTWGLPINIIGGLVALVFLCCGIKPKKYGWNYCLECPVNFGLNLGIFFIASPTASKHTKNHECGHSIQNMYFGPFHLIAVCLPSAVRFWIRSYWTRRGCPPEKDYDSIWFEWQATQLGTKLEELHKRKGED